MASRRNFKVTTAVVAQQAVPLAPVITADISQFRAKVYDSKLRKALSEHFPTFDAYPEATQNIFIDFLSSLPDPDSAQVLNISNDADISNSINLIFQERALAVRSSIMDFTSKYRSSFGPNLNMYTSNDEIMKWLSQFYGLRVAEFAEPVLQFFSGLRRKYGKSYFDINSSADIIELINLIIKEKFKNPEAELGTIIDIVIKIILRIYQSGDRFIWSTPIMVEFEKRMEENIVREFATLEGIDLFTTDASGKRVRITCKDCGKGSWVTGPRTHRGRGDEIMNLKAICKECGRPMRNV